MLVENARVQPGETVLVHAAGSGVGAAAVQVAKLHGATVIATASTEDKLERARALGADLLVLSRREDLVAEVKRLTGRRGADVVVEHVGTATWEQSIHACAWGGRIVTCGATSGWDARTDLRQVFYRQLAILGSTMASKAVLWTVLDHVAAGRLRPVVDRAFPLAEARAAHERLEQRAQFGKLVLLPGG
jgi:NADPH:quinone reductase-like Zn-dependent oxidoreductase